MWKKLNALEEDIQKIHNWNLNLEEDNHQTKNVI